MRVICGFEPHPLPESVGDVAQMVELRTEDPGSQVRFLPSPRPIKFGRSTRFMIDPVTTELERARLIRQARMGNTPAPALDLESQTNLGLGEDIVYALAKARDKT